MPMQWSQQLHRKCHTSTLSMHKMSRPYAGRTLRELRARLFWWSSKWGNLSRFYLKRMTIKGPFKNANAMGKQLCATPWMAIAIAPQRGWSDQNVTNASQNTLAIRKMAALALVSHSMFKLKEFQTNSRLTSSSRSSWTAMTFVTNMLIKSISSALHIRFANYHF